MRQARHLMALGIAAAAILSACGGGADQSSGSGSTSLGGTGTGTATASATGGDTTSVPTGSPTAGADASAAAQADNKFRPDSNGFPFPNYGAGQQDLSPVEMRAIFGDQVCGSLSGGTCTLSPPAQQWMDETNKSMQGGHCYGFSVLAMQLFRKQLTLDALGGGSSAADVKLDGNTPFTRRIAQAFAQQYLPSVRAAVVRGTPSDILDALTKYLGDPNSTEGYTFGIFKRDGTGGHAVTPYAVVDKGSGKFVVLLYDNNWPKAVREMTIDRTANTWSYNAAINPNEPSELYEGDATTQSLSMYPMSPAATTQPCPFCGGAAPAARILGADPASAAVTEYALEVGNPDSHAHLVLTDGAGHRTGIVGGSQVNEIPGAQVVRPLQDLTWKEAEEPVYYVPAATTVTITLDGTGMMAADTENITVIGSGYDVAVNSLTVAPGAKDTVSLNADGMQFGYRSDQASNVNLELGRVGVGGGDEAFSITAHGLSGAANISMAFTAEKLTITTAGNSDGTYDVAIEREATDSVATFKHDAVAVPGTATAELQYTAFTKKGDAVPATINGQQQSLSDQS